MDALEVTERSQVGQMEVFERETKVQEKLHDFIALNAMAKNAGIVCFGSSTFAKMNMLELAMDCGLNVPLYNRSIEGLTLEDSAEVLERVIIPLQPSKIFVNFGEEDSVEDVQEFVARYEWLLLNIHRTCKNCRIYIVSVRSDKSFAGPLNKGLAELSKSTGCRFVDISFGSVFGSLRPYMRSFPIDFADAMLYKAS
ncbi:MAG: hypothetical protein II558_05665 [Treponema sp.]|nr:hypothetical protein [Treponema sp.]MBQ2548375.1 hypothetical protein [Treponema sp.]